MKRSVIAAGSVLAAIVWTTAPAFATTISLTPSSQSKAYGATATWGMAWGDSSPYMITFKYGDGVTYGPTSTTAGSRGFSHVFKPCTLASYTQTGSVVSAGNTASATATTRVDGRGAC